MDSMEHTCGQGVTLAKICEQLERIKKDIEEIKENQKEYLNKQQDSEIERAKYPEPEVVNRYFQKVDAHDVYFGLIGVALLLIIGFASGIIQRIFF